jgi:signal transduction histidine kinase
MGWLIVRHDRTGGRDGAAVLGAYLCWMAVLGTTSAISDLWGPVAERRPGVLPVVGWLVGVSATGWVWLYVVPALLVLHFPTGRLPGQRWRPVRRVLLGAPFVFAALGAVSPEPYPPPFEGAERFLWSVPPELLPLFGVVTVLVLLSILGSLVLTAASVVVRRRRTGDPVVRAQLRWISLAGMLLPATLLLCWVSYMLLDGPDLVVIGLAAMWVALPVATWVAIVHHDLYDVDRIAATAVTWTVVMGVVLVGWTTATVAIGMLVGGDRPLAVAAVTASLVLALLPLRAALGSAIDRWLYPTRARVRAAVDSLFVAVRVGTALPEELEEILRKSLSEPGLTIGYHVPGSPGLHGADGRCLELAAESAVPIHVGDTEVARIAAVRPGRRPVLTELEQQIGLVAELARLRIEVRTALRETEESRRRLQQVGFAERRRLERDLHDGAQQRLVALGMNLRLAQRHLAPDDRPMRDLIDTTVAQLGTAVGELRHLAHGLRPACLDDGLGPALAPLSGAGPVPVSVAVATGELSDEVAITAYYVVMEAVTNAIKHSGATRIDVTVHQQDGRLDVWVADDGDGGANPEGTGWSGIADRVVAAGGDFTLHSPPGQGTRLEVLLPCA